MAKMTRRCGDYDSNAIMACLGLISAGFIRKSLGIWERNERVDGEVCES